MPALCVLSELEDSRLIYRYRNYGRDGSIYKVFTKFVQRRPRAALLSFAENAFVRESPMPGETIESQAGAPGTTSAVWRTVAQKAGYLDPEPLWTLESFRIEETASRSIFPQWATSFLKRFVVMVQHWSRL
jgi:hypothetical protein